MLDCNPAHLAFTQPIRSFGKKSQLFIVRAEKYGTLDDPHLTTQPSSKVVTTSSREDRVIPRRSAILQRSEFALPERNTDVIDATESAGVHEIVQCELKHRIEMETRRVSEAPWQCDSL